MFEENSPPSFLIERLRQIYNMEENTNYENPCGDLVKRANEFEDIMNKIDKGLDYDLRELKSVDLIHISEWPAPVMHAFHNIICSNEKGIIGDEYVIKFFMGMDPAYFDGVEQFEVKSFE